MVYELDVIVFVTPFKVTFMVLAFLLLTEAMLPLTVAITVVPSDCLASVKSVMFGKEYSYTVMAEDVTVTLLSLVSTKVICAVLLPEDNELVVKGNPV